MNVIDAIFQSAKKLLPQKLQDLLIKKLDISNNLEASPAGAVFMGVHILEYLGFPRYLDELLGEKHTTLNELRYYYQNRAIDEKPMIPSTGIILRILAAAMIAHPRNLTPAYKFEENAEKWRKRRPTRDRALFVK